MVGKITEFAVRGISNERRLSPNQKLIKTAMDKSSGSGLKLIYSGEANKANVSFSGSKEIKKAEENLKKAESAYNRQVHQTMHISRINGPVKYTASFVPERAKAVEAAKKELQKAQKKG